MDGRNNSQFSLDSQTHTNEIVNNKTNDLLLHNCQQENILDPLETDICEVEHPQEVNSEGTLKFFSEFLTKFRGINKDLTKEDLEQFCEERKYEVILINKIDVNNSVQPSDQNLSTETAFKQHLLPIPPAPVLTGTITVNKDIELVWNMPYNLDHFEEIITYEIFGYTVREHLKHKKLNKICEVPVNDFPMKCTIKNILFENKYYFFVRGVDIHKRSGFFSNKSIIDTCNKDV